jgi:hypothetical protein
MDCIKCGKKATISLPNLNACNGCFLKIIDKRVRKEIRINELIRSNDKILIIDDGSCQAKLSIFLLKEIIKDPTVNIKIKKEKFDLGKESEGDYTKIVIPWDADKEADYFFCSVLENSKAKYLGHYTLKNRIYLKILLHVLHQETELFCKLKKIEYKKTKKKADLMSRMIGRLEKEYPEIKFGLIKSSEEAKKIYK